MNVRFGRNLVLLAVVAAAVSATAGAADPSGPAFTTPKYAAVSSPTDKAAEARRLADQAAVLAQRAAQLAAESQASEGAPVVNQTTPWTNRDAAEVLISDAEPQPLPPVAPAAAKPDDTAAVPSIGWRSHRATPAAAIRFSDPSVPASSTLPTAAAQSPQVAAAPVQAASTLASENFELKLTEAALSSQANADQQDKVVMQAIPAVSENRNVAALPASLTLRPQSSPSAAAESYRLATNAKIADARVHTADSEEPMPAPETPYANDRPLHVGEGEPCECFDGACCPPPRPLFWTSGIEATFLAPDLNGGYADFSVAEVANDRFSYFSTDTDDIDDLYVAPRLWIGVQGCLWGVNARYWHLRANEGSFDPTLGSDGTWDGPNCGQTDFGFNSCNDFEAYTVDLEVTRRVCLYDCWMQFALGVRHAEIEHDAALSAAALADDSVIFGFANAHRQSRGTGLLLGWYGRTPIFPCSCVHWFYNFRWSALWGPTETAAETGTLVTLTSTDPDAVAAAGSVNGANTCANDTLFIGEIQLGLEWDYALRCMPANAFCRLAVEYQRWSSGTGFSQSNSFAGAGIDNSGVVTTTTLGDANALADAPELDLVGLAASTGLTW
ncbi:MAG: hypothetical protein AB7G28_12450 [Pirellulales bacterium]